MYLPQPFPLTVPKWATVKTECKMAVKMEKERLGKVVVTSLWPDKARRDMGMNFVAECCSQLQP
jgi:hypothetical protein